MWLYVLELTAYWEEIMNALATSSRIATVSLASVLFVLSLGNGAASAEDALAEEDRQAIAQLPTKYVEWALADDWDAVADLYHEDAILMPPEQAALAGRDNIRQYLAQLLGTEGGVTLESFSVDVVELQGVGDLAYARATYQFEISMTVDDEEITVQNQGPYMNILRPNEAGDWRIYRQIINRDHPPASPD
jgi:uncharacterized protein (TIGR02246 family)